MCVQMKEERFRSMFAAFGTVTDCSLKFTKDGKFRKFGFVGFKAEDDANRALKHFNRSFVDTSRVTVWFLILLGYCWYNDHDHDYDCFCEPANVIHCRWRCVRPLETPLKQKLGVNTVKAQVRTKTLLLLTLTAKRYLHTVNNWE